MKTLFITGASGFIGRHFIETIYNKNFDTIYCLSRTGKPPLPDIALHQNIQLIKGNLLDAHSYAESLASSDIVIHLAAITGKAAPEHYFNVNARGTDILIKKCKQLGVKKFLYVSSIATNFRDIRNYPYAQSKLKAEQIVKTGSIPYTILRSTIVIGRGSPILMNLIRLAKAPIVPIFGNGAAKIQPIYIEDLISCILYITENSMFHNETLDIGGPEQISIKEFIRLLHKLLYNENPKVIHIPLRPITKLLAFSEKYFFSLTPITAGQLASFTNDGTINKNHLFDRHLPSMKHIDEMLRLSISSLTKPDQSVPILERECERFTLYIAGCKSNKYIMEKYVEGHRITKIGNNGNYFDALLINTANKNYFLNKLADVYTSVFYRNAVLRKKFVLLLAILESRSATYANIDSVSEGSRLSLYARVFQKILLFLLFLLASTIAFAPVHVLCSLSSISLKKSL